MQPKNSGGSTKFPGGHKVIHKTAQTAFVRVVTPRVRRQRGQMVSVLDLQKSRIDLVQVPL